VIVVVVFGFFDLLLLKVFVVVIIGFVERFCYVCLSDVLRIENLE
jgi:hypothetical protein